MADSTMDQSIARERMAHRDHTQGTMARVMQDTDAEAHGNYHKESFQKGFDKGYKQGYKEGYEAGWPVGHSRGMVGGKRIGRREAAAEIFLNTETKPAERVPASKRGDEKNPMDNKTADSKAKESLPEQSSFMKNIRGFFTHNINKVSRVCLLSDTELPAPVDRQQTTSPIREEDVFYDARSTISEDEHPHAVDSATPNTINGAGVPHQANHTEEDLIDLFYDACEYIPAANSNAAVSNNAGNNATVTVAAAQAHDAGTATVSSAQDNQTGDITVSTGATKVITNTTGAGNSTTAESQANQPGTSTANPIVPRPMRNNILQSVLAVHPHDTHIHGIPLPHPGTMTVIIPDLTTPPLALRGPRPAYPALAGDLNIHKMQARGVRVTENAHRVVIGPISEDARCEWQFNMGRAYIRGKMSRRRNSPNGGVMLCEMVRGEHGTNADEDDGEWYVRVLFDSMDRAREAVETFGGFVCGGSLMWAWISLEEE